MIDRTRAIGPLPTVAILCIIWTRPARTQTDEIQVYNAEIAAPGVFNLTLSRDLN